MACRVCPRGVCIFAVAWLRKWLSSKWSNSDVVEVVMSMVVGVW